MKVTLGMREDFAPFNTLSYMDQLICALILQDRPSLAEAFRSRWWFWGSVAVTFSIAQFVDFKGLYDPRWWLLTSLAAMIGAVAILHHASNKSELKENFIA